MRAPIAFKFAVGLLRLAIKNSLDRRAYSL
jgi:hypothetical protein